MGIDRALETMLSGKEHFPKERGVLLKKQRRAIESANVKKYSLGCNYLYVGMSI